MSEKRERNARAAEAGPDDHVPVTEPAGSAVDVLRALFPPPTFAELQAQTERFIKERLPAAPEELVLFAGLVSGMAIGLAPTIEKLKADAVLEAAGEPVN